MANGKLDPKLQKKIVVLLGKGLTDQDTCGLVGIHKDTFYTWLAIGEAVKTGGKHDNMPKDEADQKKYADFSDAVARARARANKVAVTCIRSAMEERVIKVRIKTTHTETRVNKITGELYDYTETDEREEERDTPGDIRAAMFHLERRDSGNWGKTDKIDMTSGGEPIKGTLSTEDKMEIVALMRLYDQQQLEGDDTPDNP